MKDSFPVSAQERRRIVHIKILALAAIVLLLGVGFPLYVYSLAHPNPRALDAESAQALANILADERRANGLLSPLPYSTTPARLDLAAGSAIVIDAANGCVLYEKNADAVIPPASMVKLAVMYVAFKEIDSGKIAMNDVVPLPPESWARNAPPGSSLMFLDDGQVVTLRELLLGLAVPSGNDAAVAVANYIAGSVESFCARMNREMDVLGLTHTRFVDTSGYSELNTTTPREFAAFAKIYIERYAGALELFHSQPTMAYPQAHNYRNARSRNPPPPIVQASTNPTLGRIAGSDGLKTGFIPESGYNLALTVARDGTRIISVTMNGPGRSAIEGNAYRLQDARTITAWAFGTFATRKSNPIAPVPAAVFSGTPHGIFLVPAHNTPLTIPALIKDKTARENADLVASHVEAPKYVSAQDLPIEAGTPLGKIVYTLDGKTLAEVPLVADRTVKKASAFTRLLDRIASAILVR